MYFIRLLSKSMDIANDDGNHVACSNCQTVIKKNTQQDTVANIKYMIKFMRCFITVLVKDQNEQTYVRTYCSDLRVFGN